MATAAAKRHWQRIAEMACLTCGRHVVQIAHAHGPSLRERNPGFLKPKGKKPAWGDFLVLPLCMRCHFFMDNAPYAFERQNGSPASLLDRICELLDFDCWEAATALLKPGVTV